MRVLELTKSPYYAAFAALVVEVGSATAEARDNVRFLSPLSAHFDDLSTMDTFEVTLTLTLVRTRTPSPSPTPSPSF